MSIPMDENDWETIQNISNEVWNLIQNQIFEWCHNFKELNQPYIMNDYLPSQVLVYDSKNQEYRLVVSEMGSITLQSNQGKKHPIFYMSLRKYNDGSFIWETIDGEPMHINRLPEYLEKSILVYQKASKGE